MSDLERLTIESIAISLRESEDTLIGNKNFIELRFRLVQAMAECDELLEVIQ